MTTSTLAWRMSQIFFTTGCVMFPPFVSMVTPSIVTPALFMLVVARNATPCLAAAGVRRFPGVSPTRSCARRTSPPSATSPCRALTRSGLRNLLPIMLSTVCVQEVGGLIIENCDCFDCDLCMPAVGCADCTAKSGCFWCATSFSCTSNNSGFADAVAAECEDLTSLGGRVFNDPALPAQL